MERAKDDRRPVVLLGATMWWPLSARLAMSFLRHGCRVIAVCPRGHPLRFVTGVENLHLYKCGASLRSLEAAISSAQPDLIIPCDDGVVWQLHDLHRTRPELRPLIERSLGPAWIYPTLRSRAALLQAAVELGIRVPTTQTVASEEDLLSWGASLVLKLDGTWGGFGVEIAHSQDEAIRAFRRLAKPPGAGLAWKRFLINRDPLALWAWRNHDHPSVTAQQFIPGRPANTMLACWRGEILSSVTVEVLCAQGLTGAATVVRLVQNDEISRAARLLAGRFMLSGFYGLDFVLEQQTRDAYLIEMNPRCTQLGHLCLPYQGDLAGALTSRMQCQTDTPADPIKKDTVAFFPQAFSWNPKSPYLHHGYHDVPWEEPRLLRELLREPWPQRQWRARIYHHFRRPIRPGEVTFDEIGECHLSESESFVHGGARSD